MDAEKKDAEKQLLKDDVDAEKALLKEDKDAEKALLKEDVEKQQSKEHHGMAKIGTDKVITTVIIILVQVACLAYFQFSGFTYPSKEDLEGKDGGVSPLFYAMFIDVSIMIFFGFGFLMTFLKKYCFSAIGLCVVTSVLVVQVSLVMGSVLKNNLPVDDVAGRFGDWANLSLFTLINGLFCAGAVMISMGAVLGKVSPSQLLTMGLLETFFYWGSFSIYTTVIGAHDCAGGIILHAFGAYFGLTVTKLFTPAGSVDHKDNSTSYTSDTFSMAGSLFLWLLWPSFCGAVAEGPAAQFYAVTNCFIGLCGSVMGFAIMSRLLHGGRFFADEMQNATLAAGVTMGVPADVPMGPAIALLIGLIAGSVSTLGFAKLKLDCIGVGDTCGVHNLHGMPGLLSGIAGLVLCGTAQNTTIIKQLLGMACSIAIAVVGGLLTGLVMKILPSLEGDELFNDSAIWEVPEDYNQKVE